MATQWDIILRDAESVATLYDQNVGNPQPVRLMLTNYAGLKTVRASYDYTSAVFYPVNASRTNNPVPAQVIHATSGWFIIAKVMNLSRGAYGFNPPIRCLILHCDFLLKVYRNGILVPNDLLVMTREDAESHSEADTPFERVNMIVPVGANVQMSDMVIYDVWVFLVAEKLPENLDGHQYAYRLTLERFISLGSAGDPSNTTGPGLPVPYLVTNAVITLQRRDNTGQMQQVVTGHPGNTINVRYVPDKLSGFTTQGEDETACMYVMPGEDIEDDDIITLVSELGHADDDVQDDQISVFVATVAARIPAPLPLTKITLVGFAQ